MKFTIALTALMMASASAFAPAAVMPKTITKSSALQMA
jgi:hypothetical protein